MKREFKNFIWWGAILFPALIAVNLFLFELFLAPNERFFLNLAACIVISWLLMVTIYYVWAIYFYNINLGLTDKDWQNRETNVLITGSSDEPDKNPNSDETLGLPPGTVRGTIALSVLVCGLSMMVGSFAMRDTLKQNEFLVDHFEFLKTAFLMVIAFYFGSKSLEFLKERKMINGVQGTETSSNEVTSAIPNTAVNTTNGAIVADVTPASSISDKEFHDANSKG